MNLVVNARDAMPDGGSLDIVVESLQLDADAANTYPAVLPGLYARIAVRDTGTGIARRRAAPRLRTVFHDQGPVEGNRPWPVDRLRHREGGGRDGPLLDGARRGHARSKS